MKLNKYIVVFVSIAVIICSFAFGFVVEAECSFSDDIPYVSAEENRESGLIFNYTLQIYRQGSSKLVITGETVCEATVIKCGFKNIKVERRLNNTSSWSEYYNYGNQYVDVNVAHLYEELTVDSGYQYRVTCKHYAKKNVLNTQTISNTSNIVTF